MTQDVLEHRSSEASIERRHVVEYVRRWGGAASDAVLDPHSKIFIVPKVTGLIGYRMEKHCAVVFGDPICAENDIPHLVNGFHQHCKDQDKSVIYITASEQFARWAIKNTCKVCLEFGKELIIDPHCDPRENTGVNASLVRRKVRHALREGVCVHEYRSPNKELEQAIEQVGKEWLKARQGMQVYISHVRLFEDRLGKRWFYAKHGQDVVGVLLLNELKARQGWLLNHLMITPSSPNGTSELLVTTALSTLAQEGCHYVTFGPVPEEKLGEIQGVGKISAWFMSKGYKTAIKAFHLEGRKKFWEKFHPQSERSFLLFSQSRINFSEVVGLMRALNLS